MMTQLVNGQYTDLQLTDLPDRKLQHTSEPGTTESVALSLYMAEHGFYIVVLIITMLLQKLQRILKTQNVDNKIKLLLIPI